MIAFRQMSEEIPIVCIIGPTGSGKSARAIEEALARGGEVISVDSRQVYRGLDIGAEKTSAREMRGIPHHLIDIRNAGDPYSAGDFVRDATRLIEEIHTRGKLPILAGGTHFYFDALLYGLPEETDKDGALRTELERLSNEELYARVGAADPRRAKELHPTNRRRVIRALEIIKKHGAVPPRGLSMGSPGTRLNLVKYEVEWVVINPPKEELAERIEVRLKNALTRGLIDEVRRVRDEVGDARLNELGLEYRIVGEYLRGERDEASLLPALSAKLRDYARRQRAWIRKLGAKISA